MKYIVETISDMQTFLEVIGIEHAVLKDWLHSW